jgi:hypothetical protein
MKPKLEADKQQRPTGVAVQRLVRPWARTFQHFPEEDKCPVCGTNFDGETVLIALDGTRDGNICQAKPFHLECAVAKHFSEAMGVIYSRVA